MLADKCKHRSFVADIQNVTIAETKSEKKTQRVKKKRREILKQLNFKVNLWQIPFVFVADKFRRCVPEECIRKVKHFNDSRCFFFFIQFYHFQCCRCDQFSTVFWTCLNRIGSNHVILVFTVDDEVSIWSARDEVQAKWEKNPFERKKKMKIRDNAQRTNDRVDSAKENFINFTILFIALFELN